MTAEPGGEPVRADIVFRNAYVVTLDDERRVYRDGYVAVSGRDIVAVGPDRSCTVEAGRTVDARGKAILPGLVNAHNHLDQVLMRARFDDRPQPGAGMGGLMVTMHDLWSHAGEEISYRLVRLHMLDMLRAGTTAVHEQHFTNVPRDNMDGVLRAIDESGMRGFASRVHLSAEMIPPDARESVDAVLAETERLGKRWNSDRITVTASPINGTWVATDEELVALREGVRELGVPFDLDLSGAEWRRTLAARGYTKGGAVRHAAEIGILDDQVSGGKSFNLEPDEYAIWAEHGVTACLVPPRTRDEMGPGLHHFLAVGVVPAMGNDGPMGGPKSSVWQVMRRLLTSVAVRKEYEERSGDTSDHDQPITTELLLEMATRAGQRHLFLDPRVHGIEAGAAADLVVVDISGPDFAPAMDGRRTLSYLVHSTDASHVETVLVNGRVLVDGSRAAVWDEELVIREAEEAAMELFRRAGYLGTLPARGAGESSRGWAYIG